MGNEINWREDEIRKKRKRFRGQEGGRDHRKKTWAQGPRAMRLEPLSMSSKSWTWEGITNWNLNREMPDRKGGTDHKADACMKRERLTEGNFVPLAS